MTVAMMVVLLAGAAACSVGQGAPDGWRYVRTGAVAIALPKTWRVTADDADGLRADLPGLRGRTDAALAVTRDAPTAKATAAEPVARATAAVLRPGSASARHPAGGTPHRAALALAGSVPADARRETLALDGDSARVFSFARPAPDGRAAAQVEVRLHDPAGRPVTVRAWAVEGAAHDPALLREIVNSIEFPVR